MLEDLKTEHHQRMEENKLNNEQVIAKQENKLKEYLDNAREKYEEEKAKLEA